MNDLKFEDEGIQITPVILYIDYINQQYHNYLKKNYKDITPRDFTYLINIFYHQNCSQKDLAKLLYVSESSVAQIIKKLEKNEMIYRTDDEKNKSRNIINLTEKAKLIVFSLIKDIYEGEAKFFENYDKKDVDKFKKMLYEYTQNSLNSY